MPFESLGAVSYSPFIVTMTVFVAVCEIYSVKEWRDFENHVRGRSRSMKMAPFDRPCDFLLVGHRNLALSCTIFQLFDVRVCSRSLEMAPFDRSHTSSYSLSIVIMVLSCITCKM